MQEESFSSPSSTLKHAPWICLGAALVFIATYIYNKLSTIAILHAPIFGLVALALLLAFWRTGKTWLEVTPFIAIFVGAMTAGGSLLWAYPQYLATALLFMYIPLWLFGQKLLSLVSRVHS